MSFNPNGTNTSPMNGEDEEYNRTGGGFGSFYDKVPDNNKGSFSDMENSNQN